jgi:hypothetical protein
MSLIRFALVSSLAMAAALPAAASSPDAWAAYRKEVVTACTHATDLRRARAAGDVIDYDDTVGRSALVVTGTYPQRYMKNRTGRVLCLFDKKTRTAHVAEADRLIATKPR